MVQAKIAILLPADEHHFLGNFHGRAALQWYELCAHEDPGNFRTVLKTALRQIEAPTLAGTLVPLSEVEILVFPKLADRNLCPQKNQSVVIEPQNSYAVEARTSGQARGNWLI